MPNKYGVKKIGPVEMFRRDVMTGRIKLVPKEHQLEICRYVLRKAGYVQGRKAPYAYTKMLRLRNEKSKI